MASRPCQRTVLYTIEEEDMVDRNGFFNNKETEVFRRAKDLRSYLERKNGDPFTHYATDLSSGEVARNTQHLLPVTRNASLDTLRDDQECKLSEVYVARVRQVTISLHTARRRKGVDVPTPIGTVVTNVGTVPYRTIHYYSGKSKPVPLDPAISKHTRQ